jgi:hypothetical protein
MTLTVSAAEAHRDRHQWLRRALDELLQDYATHHAPTIEAIEKLTVEQLMAWATLEAADPTEPVGEHHKDAVLLYAAVDDEARALLSITAVPVLEGLDPQSLLLAAASLESLEHATVHDALERFARTNRRSVRLVRCIEVESLRTIVRDDDDR